MIFAFYSPFLLSSGQQDAVLFNTVQLNKFPSDSTVGGTELVALYSLLKPATLCFSEQKCKDGMNKDGSVFPVRRTYTCHGGHVQFVSLVTVTGVSLGHPNTPAVLAAVQDAAVICGAQTGVGLIAP